MLVVVGVSIGSNVQHVGWRAGRTGAAAPPTLCAVSVLERPAARPEGSVRTRAGVARGLVRAARPKQWVKQVLVLAAPAAAGVLGSGAAVWHVAVAAATFTLAAAGTYVLNDLSDVEADRRHPTKRHRPFASGAVPLAVGWVAGPAFVVAAPLLGWVLASWRLGLTLGAYVALTTLYSRLLKHVAVVELMVVAFGFVLRAIAGAAAVNAPLSQWFVIVASFGSLFMVVGKRYAEVTGVEEGGVGSRQVLGEYPVAFLRQVRDVCTAVTLLAYCLFAFERGAETTLALPWFQLSILPVTLGLLRYALLLEKGQGGAPEDVVLHDRTLLAAGAVWLVLFALGVSDA